VKNQKVTIHTIAARLNITASTVSRALSGNKRISQKTRELVNKTAAEMGYKPNHMASNLRKGKGNLIGVIIPRINRHFFSHAIAGMEAITNPAGYNLMICQTNESQAKEIDGLQTLINNRAEGVIMSISNETRNGAHIQAATDGGMPVVLFDRIIKNLNIDHVINDNFAGAYEATKHIIEQGYKNIVHFSGSLHINVYEQRLNGYKKAMNEANLDVTSDMIFDNIITRLSGEELAQTLLTKNKLPDAIFSSSDYSALGALITFKNAGINIPQDIGIVGFANEPFTELTDPALTTLEQYSEDIGRSAARLLIERIENKQNKEVPSSLSFKPQLIIRKSSQRNTID
jgi:DNA-binding LacI/PurR family transcriptional regulator